VELPTAEIVHTSSGRTRFRFAGRLGDRDFFERLANRLAGLEGVVEIRARPLTGSMIVLHEASIAEVLERCVGLFKVGAGQGAPEPGPLSLPQIEGAVAAAMTGLALMQTARGRVLPPALTLLWYAAGIAGLPARK